MAASSFHGQHGQREQLEAPSRPCTRAAAGSALLCAAIAGRTLGTETEHASLHSAGTE